MKRTGIEKLVSRLLPDVAYSRFSVTFVGKRKEFDYLVSIGILELGNSIGDEYFLTDKESIKKALAKNQG